MASSILGSDLILHKFSSLVTGKQDLNINSGALVAASLTLFLVYVLTYVIYNLYFHPLASFPGPWLARASLLWRIYHTALGRPHRSYEAAHAKYGSVFRVSPNELSFASITSWKSIYGHATNGMQPVKSKFYDMYGSGYDSLCIGSERNPKRHSEMKRNLAGAFSTRALQEQEHIINGCVDNFVTRVGELEEAKTKGLNVTKWFEMAAFDALGEMAFGESFHAIRDAKPHFWSEMIVSHLFIITIMDNLSRYPMVVTLGRYILPWLTTSVRDKHSGFTREKVERRLTSESARKDFLTNLVKKVHSGEVEREELNAHSSTLVIAGGETTGTFLAAMHYYLLNNQQAYDKLRAEIRSAFSSYKDINSAAAQRLPYLQAVINEGLRIYAPGSQGFPRVSPGMQIDGAWVPAGTEMWTSAWTVTHSKEYFHDPYKFKPERWTDPLCTDMKEASQPFSLGPRGCLGRNFAYMEISLLLAKLHFTYDLELMDKQLDWEGSSRLHIMWWKPDLRIKFNKHAS